MLTVIDNECNIDVSKKVDVQSDITVQSNILRFKSAEVLETESRQKAIDAITKKSKQLHW